MLGYLSIEGAEPHADGFAKACVLVLLVAALSVLLKSFGFKGAGVFAAAAFCAVISCFAEVFSQSLAVFEDFSAAADISRYVKACIKVIGIGYLSGISGDVCREIGEVGAAKCVGILAKLSLVYISIPFVKELFESALRMVGE